MRRIVLLLVPLLLVAGACGIESDSSPRELADDDLPQELQASTTTTTPVGGQTGRQVEVYFLANGLLRQASRDAEVRAGVDGAIEAVLAGTTEEERSEGLTTSIPAGTELLRPTDLAAAERLLTIDLSDELESLGASELRNAVAQLVFTATSFNTAAIERVRFQIDGEVVSVPTDAGTATVVTQSDYEDLDPRFADAA